jgi:mRNA interferase MazF
LTIELRRGSVVLFGERGEYTGKPRPGVIVQREATLADAPSVTLCGITSLPMPGNAARVALSPSAQNGLEKPSWVMIDKLVSIGRSRVRLVIGALAEHELKQIDVALRRWLDL